VSANLATVSAQLAPMLINWVSKIYRPSSSGMAEIVNLRIARKRAARENAESRAAKQRLVHGVAKSEREQAAADRAKARKILDQHRIEPGDRQ
jgi:Domain of unknown function (DUF4169)